MKTIEKEHVLSGGDTIVFTYPGEDSSRPWQVYCVDANDEIRWSKDFATQAEAEAEYVRFG